MAIQDLWKGQEYMETQSLMKGDPDTFHNPLEFCTGNSRDRELILVDRSITWYIAKSGDRATKSGITTMNWGFLLASKTEKFAFK